MRTTPLCRTTLILLALASLTACSSWRSLTGSGSETKLVPAPAAAPVSESSMPPVVLPSRITAVGYGALPTQEGLSLEQRRILAMRASKLDAYRSLAETVAGLKITGSSTVSAVTMTNDSFRVYVEAYLRGARVLTVTPMPSGSYETVLELQLGGEFYRDANQAIQGQPVMPRAAPAPVATNVAPKIAPKPAVAASPVASNNFYLDQ